MLVAGREPTLAGCRRCGGLWLDNAMVGAVNAEKVANDAWRFIGTVEHEAKLRDETRVLLVGYRDAAAARHCPECDASLQTTRTVGDIDIDVCAEHGVFFDANELRSIYNIIVVDAERKRQQKTVALERNFMDKLFDAFMTMLVNHHDREKELARRGALSDFFWDD